MKIAIPTDDKINISSNVFLSKFYKIVNVENVNITDEKYIENIESESEDKTKILYFLSSYDIIITYNIDNVSKTLLNDKECTLIYANERLITLAVTRFVNEIKRTRSNYCCEP